MDHSVELLTALGLAGLAVPIIQAIKLRMKVRRTLRIEGKVVRHAICWVVVGSLWFGLYAAWLFAFIVKQGRLLQMSTAGKIAMWLGIPIICTLLMVGGFLLVLLELHLFSLPAMRKRAEHKLDHKEKK
jgi:hypothetical protein